MSKMYHDICGNIYDDGIDKAERFIRNRKMYLRART